jgi:hypothetical protein
VDGRVTPGRPDLPVHPPSGRHRGGQLLGETFAPLTAQAAPGETTFVDAVQLAINTIMPNDFSSWGTMDELVQ